MTLLSDGQVLLAGGLVSPSIGFNGFSGDAELFDPAAGTFSRTGSMNGIRGYNVAVRLLDGRVLVVGASPSGPSALAAELYEPDAGRFVVAQSPPEEMQDPSGSPSPVLLKNGSVLVPAPWGSPWLYDPATGWSDSSGAVYREPPCKMVTPLRDGTVLFAGPGTCAVPGGAGSFCCYGGAGAELYYPACR